MHIAPTPKQTRGFTLIELMVVIAIVGTLAAVILGSLSFSRMKARDVRRIEDMKQIQTALTYYYDSCRKYPTDIYAAYNACSGGLAPNYIPTVPKDPVGSLIYTYAALDTNGSPLSCESYHLGVVLEDGTNQALKVDANAAAATVCTGGGTDFSSTNADSIYDKKP